MGLINEKEDPTIILDLLKKNQDLIHNNDTNEFSFHLILKIINHYKRLKNMIKNENNNTSKGNNNYIPSNFSKSAKKIDKTEINHQLERIKKWINMAKTKDNLQRTINEKFTTPQNDNLIKKMNTNNINKIIEND